MPDESYPHRDTAAARMLSEGLARASAERGVGLRQVAKEIGYRQAVVLSHMALGRVPIPIDRADQLAEHLGLEPAAFIRAVLQQRHPDVNWSGLFDRAESSSPSTELVEALEAIAGKPMDELSTEQKRVMREVAADQSPARRWLSVHEVAAIELLRRLVPNLTNDGLSRSDARTIEGLIGSVCGNTR